MAKQLSLAAQQAGFLSADRQFELRLSQMLEAVKGAERHALSGTA